MAYEGYIEYNGVELLNVARTARLARAMGLSTVHIRSEIIAALEGRFFGEGFGLGGFGLTPFGEMPIGGATELYGDITQAPWYDANYPASAEFAGIVPLRFDGLEDSTLSSTPVEYITDGGNSGKSRNTTLAIVASVALVGTSERGTEYGKRWMERVLRDSGARTFCAGADLTYLRYAASDAPLVHRRDVRQTRGVSVTRKKVSSCASTLIATFTMTAGDPYEYSGLLPSIDSLGGSVASGSGVDSYGGEDLIEAECAVYDYSPLYDPLYPALVPSPTAPYFLPDGWGIEADMTFRRRWARIDPIEPSSLNAIPMIRLTSDVAARMVRVSLWPSYAAEDEQCEPLFTAILTYLPPDLPVYIDSEQQASYAWDGASPAVRRTDSLLYGPNAAPVRWVSLNDPVGLLVTLDVFEKEDGGFEGDGTVRAEVQFMQKSD